MKKWSDAQKEKLGLWYRQNGVPSDELVKNPDVLENFTTWFNTKFTPTDPFTPEEVADQLFKLRKAGKLPHTRN